jgi:hypothetical protein
MTIIPPGSWKTDLPAGELLDGAGDGDFDVVGEVDGDVEGEVDAGGDVPGLDEVLGDTGGVLDGAVLDGGGLVEGAEEWVGRDVVRAGSVGGVVDDDGLCVGDTAGLEDALARAADAADADCSLACAEAPACEITRGVEPATSCPTRLTAVSVTAVTSAHDIAQPSAMAKGRPAHLRSARATERRWWRGLGLSDTCLVSAWRRRQ